MDDLEHTVDARPEEQEALWRRIAILVKQQIKLQLKQEDLEKRSRGNSIGIRGITRAAKGMDIMAFTADLLHAICGDDVASSPALDRARRVAPAQGALKSPQTSSHRYTSSPKRKLSCRK
ncbi:hypothetical protein NDU88_003862 [Pleurodeles waltl]|uniref:Uncharacterized protein n=1 Tax=Pleurodeles waltl TaxID=8319 RepID=A0AAV7V307_PLEWA|nr:hypothetical protein NDU88_003862 [Pleurodeles waltl]